MSTYRNLLISTVIIATVFTTKVVGQNNYSNVILWANESSNFFTSLNYPKNYPSNTDCIWHIYTNDSSRVIILNLLEFHLAKYSFYYGTADYAYLYDGNSSNSTLITMLYGDVNSTRWISSGSSLTLVFNSSNIGTDKGFKFEYKSLKKSDVCGDTNLLANETEQYFTSPGYPNKFSGDIDCQWSITSNVSSIVIALKFIQFFIQDTTCDHTYVAIYDGNSTDSPKMQTICGSADKAIFESSGNTMTVVFRSSNISIGVRSFLMQYVIQDKPDECNAILFANDEVKSITSPGFDNNVTSNINCTWTISASLPSRIVELRVLDFQLEGNQSDCQDYNVSLRDGNSRHRMDLLCGHVSNKTYTSSGRMMSVEFNSNAKNNFSGFHLQYSSIDTSVLCGETNLWANGTTSNFLTSPRYPKAYPSPMKCQWVIRAENQSDQIEFKLLDLSMPTDLFSPSCSYDSVKIYDGFPIGPYTSSASLCGRITNQTYISRGSNVTVVFQVDSYTKYRGFEFEYSSVQASEFCGNTNLTADGNIKNFTSYGYPAMYPIGVDCEWHITSSSPSQAVLLKITYAYMPGAYQSSCANDFVTIYDGDSRSSPQIDVLCGNIDRGQFFSTGSSMTLVFHSDRFMSRSSSYYTGFNLEYSSHEKPASCSNVPLTASSDIKQFTSPNYPYSFPRNTECVWHITTDSDSTVVKLTWSFLFRNDNSFYCQNYVKVYDGPSESSSLLTTICGLYFMTSSAQSTGTTMTVVFHSGNLVTDNGFSISYYSKTPISTPSSYSYSGYTIAGIVFACLSAAGALCKLLLYCPTAVKNASSRRRQVGTRTTNSGVAGQRQTSSTGQAASSTTTTETDRLQNYRLTFDPPEYSNLNINPSTTGDSQTDRFSKYNLPPAYSTVYGIPDKDGGKTNNGFTSLT